MYRRVPRDTCPAHVQRTVHLAQRPTPVDYRQCGLAFDLSHVTHTPIPFLCAHAPQWLCRFPLPEPYHGVPWPCLFHHPVLSRSCDRYGVALDSCMVCKLPEVGTKLGTQDGDHLIRQVCPNNSVLFKSWSLYLWVRSWHTTNTA